jgi:hypothetical protein
VIEGSVHQAIGDLRLVICDFRNRCHPEQQRRISLCPRLRIWRLPVFCDWSLSTRHFLLSSDITKKVN